MEGFLSHSLCFVSGIVVGVIAMASFVAWLRRAEAKPEPAPAEDDFPLLRPVYRTDAEAAALERARPR